MQSVMRAYWKRRAFRVALYAAVVTLAVAASVAYPLSHRAGPSPSASTAPAPRDFGPLPTVVGRSSRSRIQPILGHIATEHAGHAVEVRCWSDRDWVRLTKEVVARLDLPPETHLNGYVLEAGRVHLPSTACNRLVAPSPGEMRRERAAAITTFAHELQHARGIKNEARAECYALQSVEQVALELGSSRARARRVARFAWTDIYPHMPALFRSSECRDGGALDLRPEVTAWP